MYVRLEPGAERDCEAEGVSVAAPDGVAGALADARALRDTLALPDSVREPAAALGEATVLVSPRWLAANLASTTVLDASWFLPAAGRDARAEHAAARVPGAFFFDIDAVADACAPRPHTLPDARGFAAAMAALGVERDDAIVVYDAAGIFSAPRAWYTLRAFGAPRVAILNGGLPRWRAEGRTLTPAPTRALLVPS
jgi:3-mercaptopyruvate sulfurtransferase SseA